MGYEYQYAKRELKWLEKHWAEAVAKERWPGETEQRRKSCQMIVDAMEKPLKEKNAP